jgi:hypothetical protein
MLQLARAGMYDFQLYVCTLPLTAHVRRRSLQQLSWRAVEVEHNCSVTVGTTIVCLLPLSGSQGRGHYRPTIVQLKIACVR